MDWQYFPTPPQLAAEAWSLFKNRDFERVLDPSGGEGDLALARPEQQWGHKSIKIDCCEIDITKHPILRQHNFDVVGLDFLQFTNGQIYTHIIANPPFANGAKHLLHAWDICWDAEIVCILNADTIRNPYCFERQRLCQLIEEHGHVQFRTGAFMVDEAQRKTNVEIALVYLKKTADINQDVIGDLFAELKLDHHMDGSPELGFKLPNEIAVPNSDIENSVIAFNAAVHAMKEAIKYRARADHYARLLGETMAQRNAAPGQDIRVQQATVGSIRKGITEEYQTLKDRAWSGILRSTNVTSKLSSAAQRRVESEFETIKKLEFTVPNIYGFLLGLAGNQGKIQREMVNDVFDLITRYHSDNTVFYKGWISNDRHRMGARRIKKTRFILPRFATESYQRSLGYDQEQRLRDIDKVFAMLDGKPEPDFGLVDAFNTHFQSLRNGARVQTSYFDVRYYSGIGTIHFFAKSQEVMDKLNRYVGRSRGWLPDEGEKVSDAFWQQYDKAEKFDKEIRQEVRKHWTGYRYDDPLSYLDSTNHENHQKTMMALDTAVTAVLERNGIDVNFQLEQKNPQQQLLLAA